MADDEAVGASKALRNAVKRLSSIRGIAPKHTDSPRRDFDEIADEVEHATDLMTQFAIEGAKAQGKPFRNPRVRKGVRLYPV